jgi:hypothetical protein
MSELLTRLVLNRGDSVAILLHDPVHGLVLLCEQFRVPTCERGPGWLLKLPAGWRRGRYQARQSSAEAAIARARDGQIEDAKTLIALQWLELAGGSPRNPSFPRQPYL